MKKYNHDEFVNQFHNLNFDYLFTCASFEKRCFIIPELLGKTSTKTIIFYNYNENHSITENSKKIKKINPTLSNVIELNSDNPVSNYIVIFDVLTSIFKTKKHRPNLLLDITTFTHETLLVILKLLSFNKDRLGKIFMAYVGAEEYSIFDTDDADKWLSKGIKEIRTVIGYPGFSDPTKQNHLIILFGFESERTEKIIDEYQYDYVSLGFANIENSIQLNHQKINCDRHTKLMKEFSAKQFEFSLIDAVKVKNQLLEYVSCEKYAGMNTVIAPMNNKLSTIGAGLAAIANENIQLTYAKPNIYNIHGYSSPNDDIYFGELDFN